MPLAAMDGFRDYHSKLKYKSDKDKYHIIMLICGILRSDTNEFIYMMEIDSQNQKTNVWLSRFGGGIKQKFGTHVYTCMLSHV